MLDSQPGTLILNDCIETCRKNSSCKSINFETGLCVLFSSSADDNKGEESKFDGMLGEASRTQDSLGLIWDNVEHSDLEVLDRKIAQ